MLNRSRSLVCSLLLAAAALGRGQQTKSPIVPPGSARPSAPKPNSDSVPDVYAIRGQFARIVLLRFKYQSDLLDGLVSKVKEEKIRNAVILSGIGAVRNYAFHSISNRSFPTRNIAVKDPTGPADILSMNGYVIDGQVHAHITMSTPDGALGGHLESGTTVFSFAIVTLGVLSDSVDLTGADDTTYR